MEASICEIWIKNEKRIVRVQVYRQIPTQIKSGDTMDLFLWFFTNLEQVRIHGSYMSFFPLNYHLELWWKLLWQTDKFFEKYVV